MICLECKISFESRRNNQKFCTSSCTNRYKVREWKRKKRKEKSIVQCGFHQRTWETMNLTVDEYTKGQGISKFKNGIRGFAQNWNPELKDKPCYLCGYEKHIEYAHIKPIVSFNGSTLLKEINSINNLVPLCPNCHWEFDNGLVSLYNYRPHW